MKYTIEFELPNNKTIEDELQGPYVSWAVWGHAGVAKAKPVSSAELERKTDGDTTSRQGAINAIENTDCELLPCEWDELTNAIMQWPSAQQWIPVTEKLPDNSKGVLVTRKTIIGNHRVIDIAYYYEIMNTWVTGDLYTITVDAWMPLPEPWEETKERKEHCE